MKTKKKTSKNVEIFFLENGFTFGTFKLFFTESSSFLCIYFRDYGKLGFKFWSSNLLICSICDTYWCNHFFIEFYFLQLVSYRGGAWARRGPVEGSWASHAGLGASVNCGGSILVLPFLLLAFLLRPQSYRVPSLWRTHSK